MEEGGAITSRKVHRNLFTLGNPYPQKKVITFNRSQQDFGFTVNLGDLSHLSPSEVRSVGCVSCPAGCAPSDTDTVSAAN